MGRGGKLWRQAWFGRVRLWLWWCCGRWRFNRFFQLIPLPVCGVFVCVTLPTLVSSLPIALSLNEGGTWYKSVVWYTIDHAFPHSWYERAMYRLNTPSLATPCFAYLYGTRPFLILPAATCQVFGNSETFKRAPLPAVLENVSRFLKASLVLFWGRWGLPIPFKVGRNAWCDTRRGRRCCFSPPRSLQAGSSVRFHGSSSFVRFSLCVACGRRSLASRFITPYLFYYSTRPTSLVVTRPVSVKTDPEMRETIHNATFIRVLGNSIVFFL